MNKTSLSSTNNFITRKEIAQRLNVSEAMVSEAIGSKLIATDDNSGKVPRQLFNAVGPKNSSELFELIQNHNRAVDVRWTIVLTVMVGLIGIGLGLNF